MAGTRPILVVLWSFHQPVLYIEIASLRLTLEPSMPTSSPRTIPAGEFKTRCLSLMDTVRDTGEEIVITKHGHPVVRLVPIYGTAEVPELFGSCRGEITVHGDIVAAPPLDEGWKRDWMAQWAKWLEKPVASETHEA